jgi:CRP-like cAMP-binding protein
MLGFRESRRFRQLPLLPEAARAAAMGQAFDDIDDTILPDSDCSCASNFGDDPMNIGDARRLAEMQPGWLAGLSEPLRSEILGACSLHRYRTGEQLHAHGDESYSMYGIVGGQVKLYLPGSDGETYLAHLLSEGYWAGEGPSMLGAARPVSLVAARPTHTLRLGRPAMAAISARWPEFGQMMLRQLMGHLTLALGALADSMIADPKKRTVAVLLRLGGLSTGIQSVSTVATDIRIELPLRQQELASLVRLSRTALNSILWDLRDLGLLKTDYARMTILDPNGLRDLLSG